jgi:serine phosphatase RsbU (regulator of sigma subunit)
METIRDRFPPRRDSPNPEARAIATGRSELLEVITPELIDTVSVDAEHAAMTRELRYRSAVVVPLPGRREVLGAITLLATDRSGRRYGDADLALAEDLARRVGTLLDNVRLYEREHHTLHVLQRSLLPPALPDIPEMEAAARFHPAGAGTEVGGDFYDLFPVGWGSWGLVVGDVCGKGAEAAAASAQVRHGLRALAAPELAPSATLARLNDVVIRSGTDRFSTVVYARLDPSPGDTRLLLSRAGHPFPIVLRTNGTVEVVGGPGTVLGIFPGARYEDRSLALAPGDAIVVYTDGVLEHARGEAAAWLKYLVASCRGLDAEGIASRIEAAALDSSLREDDVAILVLRVRPTG